MRKLLHSLALSALGLAALMAPRPARADDLSPYGINVHAPAGAQLNPQLDRVERAGIGWVRIDFIWAAVETQRGVYDWHVYDALVGAAEQRGLSVLAIIAYTPQWATDGPEIAGVPRDVEDWKTFCTKAAKRYRGRIAAWEICNEPNLTKFWTGSRQQYWQQILIPGADAIHAADPHALVAGPALAHVGSRDWHHWLLETLQTAGDRIDVVTHHLYDGDGSPTGTAGPPGSAQIEDLFNDYFDSQNLATDPTPFDGRSDYGPFIAVGIPAGGLFSGAEGEKTVEEATIYGGTAGAPYDPCYHQACDTTNNLSTKALNELGDGAAHAVMTLARTRTGFFEDGSLRARAAVSAKRQSFSSQAAA